MVEGLGPELLGDPAGYGAAVPQPDVLSVAGVIRSDVPGTFAMALRRPLGVVAGISPWNGAHVLAWRTVGQPAGLRQHGGLRGRGRRRRGGGDITSREGTGLFTI